MANSTLGLMREIEATANRLRLIQIDLGEETEEERKSILAEELKQQLGSVPRNRRGEFLEQLERRFPAWDRQVEVSVSSEEGVHQSEANKLDLQDWSFLVTRLSDLAADLSEEQRQVIRDRLATVGLAYNRPDPGWSASVFQTARDEFGLDERQEVDASRALELLMALARCVKGLNKVVWPIWREIDHRSRIRGGGVEFEQLLGRFLSGDRDIDLTSVSGDIDRLRKHTTALVGAIRGGAVTFAQSHCERLSVSRISRLVEEEGGMFSGITPAKCWRKFETLAEEELDQDSIQRNILEAVKDTTNHFLER